MEKFFFVLMQSNKNSKYLWGNMEKKNLQGMTKNSMAVTHPSTNRARHCLTSVIRPKLMCAL